MSEMRLRVHREIPEDEEFRRQWNGLVEAMERPEVFYTWEWAAAVAHAYGEALKPMLFAGYEGEKLVGIAALAVDSEGGVCFLASTTADYCDFVSAPGNRKELIERVMGELRGMGTAELKLANLPADSASAAALRAAGKRSGYATFARPAYRCAQVVLGSAEERAQIRKDVGRKVKRMTKAAGELGSAAVSHGKSWEEFSEEFPEFAVSHVGRFLSAGEVSNLALPERQAFLLELARLLSRQGWLTLSTLKIEGRTVAWNCGFRFAGNWFYYQPTFDLEARRLSPGSYLLCRILQDAAADVETCVVELGLGDEGYKKQYANAGRQILCVTASRSRMRWAREVYRYRAAKLVKRFPRMEEAVRACISKAVMGMTAVRERRVWSGIRGALARAARSLGRAREVHFFEYVGAETGTRDHGLEVRPLSIRLLATAAMENAKDPSAFEYLLEAAERQQSGHAEGFAVVASDGSPVHFCWVGPFEGFRMRGLDGTLKAPMGGSMLIREGWTPASQRGGEHEARCASLVAGLVQEGGRSAWAFSADANYSAELERAGFALRFSLVRRKKLFFSRTQRVDFADHKTGVMNLYPAA